MNTQVVYFSVLLEKDSKAKYPASVLKSESTVCLPN